MTREISVLFDIRLILQEVHFFQIINRGLEERLQQEEGLTVRIQTFKRENPDLHALRKDCNQERT